MEKFTFIDLFAGIGAFRIALEKLGGTCVYSSEIDKHACQIYQENFNENPYSDITTVDAKEIPDFDILCAGFPCQSFSICGQKKGFLDETRGTLFFDIVRILNEKKPKAFILENVKNLAVHDEGRTMSVILDSLTQLGYIVNYQILNAKDFGVPQNRERVFIVGSIDGKHFDFGKLQKSPVNNMKPFLDEKGDFQILQPSEYTLIAPNLVNTNGNSGLRFVGYRNKNLRKKGVRPNTEHLSRVHKQPNRIYSVEGTHPTLAAGETSGRYWIYDGKIVRKLTLNECFRFFGFPEDYKKIGPESELYKRIGNSVCIPVVEAVGKQVLTQILFDEKNDCNPSQYLENIYQKASALSDIYDLPEWSLTSNQLQNIQTIVQFEETQKAVFTVLTSSMTYKHFHPEQDIRYHQIKMPNGYSGRSFDTNYVTPFLRQKHFAATMSSGSGWLTRSLEQTHPFTLDFPGNIQSKKDKRAFLECMNDVEEKGASPEQILTALFFYSIKEKNKRMVNVINPCEKESNVPISKIIKLLEKHFTAKYSMRGASILPVIALYSIYQCLMKDLERFTDMHLDDLASHYSSDKSSKATGDIVVRNALKEIYEVVEVKFDISPTLEILENAYEKVKSNPTIQRYYILSTKTPDEDEQQKIDAKIDDIYQEHGCQFIVNGIYTTLKYYLRLLKNTDEYLSVYAHNLQSNKELPAEYKVIWNNICENYRE